MALKSEYLASENAVAERRSRTLHRFIVGSPIFLLLAVGLVGHVHPKPYARPASDATYDRRVMAYQKRVATVEAMLNGPKSSTESLETEACRWTAGYASGDLVAVLPALFEDHLRDGVRGQILRSGLSLAAALNERAEAELQEKLFSDAGRDALLAAETARGLRGFEIQALLESLLTSRHGLSLLAQAWPRLSAAERSSYRDRLGAMTVDGNEVAALVALDRQQAEDYKRRQKIAKGGLAPFGMGDLGVAAADRSVRMTNERLRSLLGSGI